MHGFAKELRLQPSFLARLFGVSAVTIKLTEKRKSIAYSVGKTIAKNVSFSGWKWTSGLLSNRLTLLDESGYPAAELKTPRNTKEVLETFLFYAVHADDVEKFCDALAVCTNGENYFSNSILNELKTVFEQTIYGIRENLGAASSLIPQEQREAVKFFVNDETGFREVYNNAFIASESKKWRELFEKLEDNPLTDKQIESVVTEEDATLVVAGAGTGKTSSVVGKIGYLLNAGRAKPAGILALAFNRDAAQEMRDRVKQKTGHKIEIRTFHSYGKFLIENEAKEKLKIADFERFERAKLAHVNKILAAMYEDDEESNLIVNFLSFHRYPAKFREDFNSQRDYLSYMSKMQPVTLNDEWVKSFEEVLIADWLTLHGVEYEYEKPYEFKTSSRFKRQYQPDFYLPKYDIYLEHFGVDKKGRTAPWMDNVKYNEGIKWKRSLHAQNGTKLVETYSWERMEGVLSLKLKEKLEAQGVKIERVSKQELQNKFETKRVNERLVSLIKDFLSVSKEGQWKIGELQNKVDAKEASERRRFEAFLKIFEAFLRRYENHLTARGELDFADLIAKATDCINSGKAQPHFTHIIVDEFQDISRGRSNFLRAVRASSKNAKLMCVGDDWQSIYGFTGSDVHITTKFSENFGFFRRVDLDRTFRFRQPLIDVSSRFIQQNPAQLTKDIRGREAQELADIEVVQGDEINLQKTINDILSDIRKTKPDRKASVLFLGRYNFTEPDFLRGLKDKFKSLDISFLTIHKSKGLQADYVVILGLENAKFGFPGSIATDPIMSLVIPSEEDFEDAEERRVFYVALTRAKEKVYLVKPTNPSKFLTEVMNYDEVAIDKRLSSVDTTCPSCETGSLILKFPNRVNGYAWRCSYGRYCDGKAKFCSECLKYPMVNGVCVNEECKPTSSSKRSSKRSRR